MLAIRRDFMVSMAIFLFFTGSAHAMGKKILNATAPFNGDTKPLRTVKLDKKRIELDFDNPIATGADPANSLTLIRTKDTPNQVTLKVTETNPQGDSRCTEWETKTYHGQDDSCGTGVKYVNDCRDERECKDTTVTTPGQPPVTTTTCETEHRCGVYPEAYTLECDYTRQECTNSEDVATQSSYDILLTFRNAPALTGDQTEEFEFIYATDRKTDTDILRANRTVEDYRIRIVKDKSVDTALNYRLTGIPAKKK